MRQLAGQKTLASSASMAPFHVTYTAFNNVSAQLCMATSADLLNWTKVPPLFPGWMDVAYSDIDIPMSRVNHCKSGSIVSEQVDGLYHLYWVTRSSIMLPHQI